MYVTYVRTVRMYVTYVRTVRMYVTYVRTTLWKKKADSECVFLVRCKLSNRNQSEFCISLRH